MCRYVSIDMPIRMPIHMPACMSVHMSIHVSMCRCTTSWSLPCRRDKSFRDFSHHAMAAGVVTCSRARSALRRC